MDPIPTVENFFNLTFWGAGGGHDKCKAELHAKRGETCLETGDSEKALHHFTLYMQFAAPDDENFQNVLEQKKRAELLFREHKESLEHARQEEENARRLREIAKRNADEKKAKEDALAKRDEVVRRKEEARKRIEDEEARRKQEAMERHQRKQAQNDEVLRKKEAARVEAMYKAQLLQAANEQHRLEQDIPKPGDAFFNIINTDEWKIPALETQEEETVRLKLEAKIREESEKARQKQESLERLRHKQELAREALREKEASRMDAMERAQRLKAINDSHKSDQGAPIQIHGDAGLKGMTPEQWRLLPPEVQAQYQLNPQLAAIFKQHEEAARQKEQAMEKRKCKRELIEQKRKQKEADRLNAMKKAQLLQAANEQHRLENGISKPGESFFKMLNTDEWRILPIQGDEEGGDDEDEDDDATPTVTDLQFMRPSLSQVYVPVDKQEELVMHGDKFATLPNCRKGPSGCEFEEGGMRTREVFADKTLTEPSLPATANGSGSNGVGVFSLFVDLPSAAIRQPEREGSGEKRGKCESKDKGNTSSIEETPSELRTPELRTKKREDTPAQAGDDSFFALCLSPLAMFGLSPLSTHGSEQQAAPQAITEPDISLGLPAATATAATAATATAAAATAAAATAATATAATAAAAAIRNHSVQRGQQLASDSPEYPGPSLAAKGVVLDDTFTAAEKPFAPLQKGIDVSTAVNSKKGVNLLFHSDGAEVDGPPWVLSEEEVSVHIKAHQMDAEIMKPAVKAVTAAVVMRDVVTVPDHDLRPSSSLTLVPAPSVQEKENIQSMSILTQQPLLESDSSRIETPSEVSGNVTVLSDELSVSVKGYENSAADFKGVCSEEGNSETKRLHEGGAAADGVALSSRSLVHPGHTAEVSGNLGYLPPQPPSPPHDIPAPVPVPVPAEGQGLSRLEYLRLEAAAAAEEAKKSLDFIPKPVYSGKMDGYYFTTGAHGLGYYKDPRDTRHGQTTSRMEAGGASKQPYAHASMQSKSPAKSKNAADNEENDDDDDDDEEEDLLADMTEDEKKRIKEDAAKIEAAIIRARKLKMASEKRRTGAAFFTMLNTTTAFVQGEEGPPTEADQQDGDSGVSEAEKLESKLRAREQAAQRERRRQEEAEVAEMAAAVREARKKALQVAIDNELKRKAENSVGGFFGLFSAPLSLFGGSEVTQKSTPPLQHQQEQQPSPQPSVPSAVAAPILSPPQQQPPPLKLPIELSPGSSDEACSRRVSAASEEQDDRSASTSPPGSGAAGGYPPLPRRSGSTSARATHQQSGLSPVERAELDAAFGNDELDDAAKLEAIKKARKEASERYFGVFSAFTSL